MNIFVKEYDQKGNQLFIKGNIEDIDIAYKLAKEKSQTNQSIAYVQTWINGDDRIRAIYSCGESIY
jgi:hypothetical protein